jgi:hypothetical protein
MKKEFIGFYSPTGGEIDLAWENGHFAFDTNALLNLYRYTESTRKDFLAVLNKLDSRLFLPYQAALEFHNARLKLIKGLANAHNDILELIKSNFLKALEPQISHFKKHPSIIVENIFKLHTEFLRKVSQELSKQKKNHPEFDQEDAILEELTNLFDDKLGEDFDKDVLNTIYLEGKERYSMQIPPGYKDSGKKGERQMYGDLIIWKELIGYVNKEKKPLIFVTDDRKEDWWTIEGGETVRPREELIKEFFNLTGVRILIYNADAFLQYAKERKLVPKIKETSIKEVQEIRKSEEVINELLTMSSNLTASDFLANKSQWYNSPSGATASGHIEQFRKAQESLNRLSNHSAISGNMAEILRMQERMDKLSNHSTISPNIAEILRMQERMDNISNHSVISGNMAGILRMQERMDKLSNHSTISPNMAEILRMQERMDNISNHSAISGNMAEILRMQERMDKISNQSVPLETTEEMIQSNNQDIQASPSLNESEKDSDSNI